MLSITRKSIKFMSCFLASVFIVSQASIANVAAETNKKGASTTKTSSSYETFTEKKYSQFIKETNLKQYNGQAITYKASSIFSGSGQEVSDTYGSNGKVIKVVTGDDATFTINAPEDALYYIKFSYLDESDSILPVETSLKVNGEYSFYEMRRMVFENRWVSPETIPLDKYGNQIVPTAKKVKTWDEKYVMDASYRYSDPLLVPLKKGDNTLDLTVEEGTLLINEISLANIEKVDKYTEQKVSGNEFVKIEAEDITYRNDSSIRPASEFNVDVTPYNSDNRVLNIIDSWSYKKAGQRVEYEFNVDKAGYYYVGFNYRQNTKIDFPVFADITIDGKLPNQQMKDYPFDYTSKFKTMTLKNQNTDNNMAVYLEQGKHTIGATLSVNPLRDTMESIDAMMKEIEELSLEITKLTGAKSDKYRDFELDKYIPGIKEKLLDWADRTAKLYDDVHKYNPDVKKIGAFAELPMIEEQLRSLAEKPNDLPKRMTELSKGSSSVKQYMANLLQNMGNNGLSFDKIYIYQNEKDLPKGANIGLKVVEGIKRFVLSFTKQDYSTDNVNPDHLQVWVNRPRQYVEILQNMINESFTPQTGIKVDLSLMPDQNKLTLANAAGEAPDVATAINYALPSDLALRGALKDLTEYSDFNEVKTRFPQGLLIPSMIGDSVYSVPETLNFWVMYYRKDILQSLNIPVPNTIEEVKRYLPELQRKGMNFYYPTAGMSGLKTFAGTMPIIYQSGGSFYGDTLDKTTLTSEESIKGIKELTELFTIYNMPYDVPSFYQEFRDGTLPIGIAEYGMYNLLTNAAPEIANSWDIALVPGIENDKGEIQRWTAGGAENCVIFNDTNMPKEAWEYLKWWTSKDTQVQFGNTLQVTYGKEYIWNTANIEAFKELPWNTKHKNIILQQTQWLVEPPRVPGSYMVERELSNAYNSIVLDGKNLRTAIDLASKRIDREINRKLEEFGYRKNGVTVKPYVVPKID